MPNNKIASFFYLKIFLLIFIFFIICSIIYQIVTQFTGSSFRNNSFSLLYVSGDSKLIYVDRKSKNALFLALGDIKKLVKGKNPLEASFVLGIPINGVLIDEFSPQNLQSFVSVNNIMRLIFFENGNTYRKVNKFDLLKLSSVLREIPKDNWKEVRLNIFNQEEFRDKIGDSLRDTEIVNNPITIEIDNATNVNGLGNNLSIILGHQGYNIISVRTSNTSSGSFIASKDLNNIVVKSLQGLTGFPLKKESFSQTSDITIFLGDEVDAMLSY